MSVKTLNMFIVVVNLILFGISLLLFAEITVRRLRKNPATKEALGMSLVNGYDIMNVAMALSLPRRFMRWAKKSRFPGLYADVDVLYQHTTRFDRVLARVHHTILWITVIHLVTVSYIW